MLLIPSAFKLYHDIKIRNYNFLIFFVLLFAILFIHIGLNLYYEKIQITKYSLFGSIFLLSIFTISYYYFQFINKNIDFLIKLFIALFFLSCLYGIYDGKHDSPYFCGGIPNFINTDLVIDRYGIYGAKVDEFRLSFGEFIFPENSHLGMIAPSILAYSVYKMTTQKYSTFHITSLLVFIFICMTKSSTTLFVGTAASLIVIILFNYKTLNKKTLLSFFILIAFMLTILFSDKECRARFIPTTAVEKNLTVKNEGKNLSEDKRLYAIIFHDYARYTSYNMSSASYYNALEIAKKSIFERPLGWGLNRYDQAFYQFNRHSGYDTYTILNDRDGTNNLIKMVVELGVFSIIFYLFMLLFLINNKISLELKLFYLPFIITQSLRGAGYFNGGFILIAFIMLFTYINVYKKA